MNFAFAKAGLAIALLPLSVDAVRTKVEPVVGRASTVAIVSLFALSRISAALVVFVAAGFDYPGDIRKYYEPFGIAAVTQGRVATSPYNAGFDYLVGGLLWMFHSPLSIVLAMTIAETVAFALVVMTLRRYRSSFASGIVWLWGVAPLSLLNVALNGQDEALVLLAWSVTFFAVAAGRDVVAAVLGGVGIALTKILALFSLLPLTTGSGRQALRSITLSIGVVGAIAATFIWLRVPVLGFLSEAGQATPGNAWMWFALVANKLITTAHLWQVAVAAIVLSVAFEWMRRLPADRQEEQTLRLTGVLGCLFLLLSPKSFTAYSVMFLPGLLFLILTLPPSARLIALALFVPITVLEPGLWFRLGEARGVASHTSARVAMLAADTVLLFGYLTLSWTGLRFRRARPLL